MAAKASAMTASFSVGFNEHVEYTIREPDSDESICIARFKMRN